MSIEYKSKLDNLLNEYVELRKRLKDKDEEIHAHVRTKPALILLDTNDG